MSEPEIRGRFVWHELMTTDPADAQQCLDPQGAAFALHQRKA